MIASPRKESWIIGLGSGVDNREIIALCKKMVEELGDSCPDIVKIPRKGSSDIRIEFECLSGFEGGHYIITESTLEYLRARVELMILEHKVRMARIDLSKLRPTRWSVDCLGGDSW